jgi:saccharopine dehydrogenase (NAD+, L-lysine forming)
MSTKPTVLHLRSEQKPLEHRSCLTPTTVKALLDAGYEVHVEKSPADPRRSRIYKDDEFAAVGAKLVEDQSWQMAPSEYEPPVRPARERIIFTCFTTLEPLLIR